jgi:hypothetical protein
VSDGGLAEGWSGDPLGRHQQRWCSKGIPTALVRDGDQESQDPVSADELRSVGTLMSPATPVSGKPPVQLTDLGPSRTERFLIRRDLGRMRQRKLNRRLAPYRMVVFGVMGVCVVVAGIHALGKGKPATLPEHEVVGTVAFVGIGQQGVDAVGDVTVTYVMPHYGQHDLYTSTDNFSAYGVGEQVVVSYVPGSPLSARIVSRYRPKPTIGGVVVIVMGSVFLAYAVTLLVQLLLRHRNRDRTWSPTPLT